MFFILAMFEKEYGNLQEKYNAWRKETEETGAENGEPYYIDCVHEKARESFSEYSHLSEIIPFDVMLWYEGNYQKS